MIRIKEPLAREGVSSIGAFNVEDELLKVLLVRSPRRLCEINAQSPASVRRTMAVLQGLQEYLVVTFGQNGAWRGFRPPVRVLHATAAFTVRANDIEQQLGQCDAIVVRHEAPSPAARTALLSELTLLLQHASDSSLIALVAADCTSRPRGQYTGPFWMFNLTEPCPTERFEALAAAGTLDNVHCKRGRSRRTFSPEPLGQPQHPVEHRVLCLGTYTELASACARQRPLLERWNVAAPQQATELPSAAMMARPTACNVRKQVVRVASRSWLWSKATHARSTLSHLYRRHYRYFSALPCVEDRVEQVCLLFKDEVNEEYVAGLHSTDGLFFPGDPTLVMPRMTVKAQPAPLVQSLTETPSTAPTSARAHAATAAAVNSALSDATSPNDDPSAAPGASTNPVGEWRNLTWAEVTRRVRRAGGRVREHDRRRASRLANRSAALATISLLASSMTHNLALAQLADGMWIAVGGRQNRMRDHLALNSPLLLPHVAATLTQRLHVSPARLEAPRIGVWMVSGRSWRFDGAANEPSAHPWLSPQGGVDEPPTTQWHHKRLLLNGLHPGCVERRDVHSRRDFSTYLYEGGVCEFDGRLALVPFRGELLLYARANLAASGRRHVQLTRAREAHVMRGSAEGGSSSAASPWSPFETVSLEGYDETGDVYFWGAQVNPVHNGSLIAVFPLVHRLRACIAIAASLDGIHWSRATPLLGCRLYGERTIDQPASPSMIRRGGEVWFYVQEEVPGITVERTTPLVTHTALLKAEKPSRVVRYAIPCLLLARWTDGALRKLQRHEGLASTKDTRHAFTHSCPVADAMQGVHDPDPPTRKRGDAKTCSWSTRGDGQKR